MIEPIMYFGIGFLVAALLGLLFVPLVHNRAVRLTRQRLEAATPLSIAEIRADKDQLRAEFAMSTRRLEINVDQMKNKTTTQLAELGKKSDAINQLKKELGDKTAAIFNLESRDKTLRDQLRATEEEFELKSSSLREAERTLSDKEAELAKLLAELGERSITADSQRVELAALRTQVEAMKVSVTDYEHSVKETEERLARERTAAATAAEELKEARSRLENLGARATELERQLVVQTTEAEILSRRVQELEVRLGEQGRVLAEREFAVDRMRGELEGARKTEADLRERAFGCRQPQHVGRGKIPRRYRRPRHPARRRGRGAHQAAARGHQSQARSGIDLGGRAGRERAVARAHQRRRRRGGAAHRRARRPRTRRSNSILAAGAGRRPRQRHTRRRRQARGAAAGQRLARRPHPRAAIDRVPRRVELTLA